MTTGGVLREMERVRRSVLELCDRAQTLLCEAVDMERNDPEEQAAWVKELIAANEKWAAVVYSDWESRRLADKVARLVALRDLPLCWEGMKLPATLDMQFSLSVVTAEQDCTTCSSAVAATFNEKALG